MTETADATGEESGSPTGRQLEEDNLARISEDAPHFLERPILVGHMVEGDDHHDPFEVSVGKGDRFGVAFLEANRRPKLPAQPDLPPIRLEDDNLPGSGREPLCRCSGPTADIEEPHS